MSKDTRLGPIWTSDDSVEVQLPRPLSADDREALRTGYIGPHLLNRELGDVLDAVAAMRQRRQPENPAMAMAAAEKIRRMMAAVVDELMVSEMVGHGETGFIMGVTKGGAQYRRKVARDVESGMDTEEWMFRHDIGLRPKGANAREWYGVEGTEDDGQAGNTVVNIATGTVGIQSANSVNSEDVDL